MCIDWPAVCLWVGTHLLKCVKVGLELTSDDVTTALYSALPEAGSC